MPTTKRVDTPVVLDRSELDCTVLPDAATWLVRSAVSGARTAGGPCRQFDDRARSASAELWIAKRKPRLALGAAMPGAVIAGAAVTARHDDE